jgi:hypothetical protein
MRAAGTPNSVVTAAIAAFARWGLHGAEPSAVGRVGTPAHVGCTEATAAAIPMIRRWQAGTLGRSIGTFPAHPE